MAAPGRLAPRARRRADMPLLGGIRPPLAALLVLLIAVSAVTALVLGRVERSDVPRATELSEQHIAEDGATALRAALDESSGDLRREAAMFNAAARPAAPDQFLGTLGSVYHKWRGTAVVDLGSGELLASRGETVPLSRVDLRDLGAGLAPRLVTTKSGTTRLLNFALLAGQSDRQELLIASDSLDLPAIAVTAHRTLEVVDASGAVLAATGPGTGDDAVHRLAVTAVRTEKGHGPSESAKAGGFDAASGFLLGRADHTERTVAGYAALSSSADDTASGSARLGLTVLTTLPVDRSTAAVDHRLFAVAAAAVLLAIAVAVSIVFHRTLQRPLLVLHREARRLAAGDFARPVPALRFGEPALIAAALESLRKQLLGVPVLSGRAVSRRQQDRTGIRTVLVLCAVLMLAWSVPLLLLVNRAGPHTAVPRQLVADERDRTVTSAARVREGLNEGYADLASLASALRQDPGDAQTRKLLGSTIAEHGRYRSLYVVDKHGAVLIRVGGSPWTPTDARTRQGLGLVDRSRPVPVIAARAPVAGGDGRTVVGEFDIAFLNGILNRPGMGHVWLVDKDQKVIASNTGYLAFQSLPDHRSADVARSAESTPISTLLGGRKPALTAAAPILPRGEAATFARWHVVAAEPASWLSLPENDAQSRTMLAGLLGLAAATVCLGWLHILVVRPLRALTRDAEALVAGDRRTVRFPAQNDEVGSVVRSLELIRQRLAALPSPPAASAPPPGGEDTDADTSRTGGAVRAAAPSESPRD
ncbi:HAMP domain-containing protein [Streptomyces polygonati]|uniref:histidine kinase n=1 Tax=Streptomyces polygonati TaxID=1617087 RepID=A0ABV8HD76_9ACTN